jgi:hypothetical protein
MADDLARSEGVNPLCNLQTGTNVAEPYYLCAMPRR